ncbi:MAG TPA: TerC family protein [Rhodothermales bacterium]|nr:TerC family protein [Rhodothermales bacterium]
MRPPHLDVPTWVWVAFNAYVIVLLLVDLLGFNRESHKIEWREAARLSALFVGAALLVNLFVWLKFGHAAGITFFTGYLVEISLSVDNLFVIAVLFGFFGVPAAYQHRVLFWGIFGAILMRATMIFIGVALVERFHWILWIFGLFLIFTGLRMLKAHDEPDTPGDNPLLRALRRVLPVTRRYHGERFFIKKMGRTLVTPLFLVLVMIELTDVIFAVDSIPAILGITTDPFLAYASNIMAVAGLRAMFFLLVGVIEQVRYLHIGLGLVLTFIGGKMLAEPIFDLHVPTWLSLVVVTGLIAASAVFSWVAAVREQRREGHFPAPLGTADGPTDAREEDLVDPADTLIPPRNAAEVDGN